MHNGGDAAFVFHRLPFREAFARGGNDIGAQW